MVETFAAFGFDLWSRGCVLAARGRSVLAAMVSRTAQSGSVILALLTASWVIAKESANALFKRAHLAGGTRILPINNADALETSAPSSGRPGVGATAK
jgi:hypothetical protein